MNEPNVKLAFITDDVGKLIDGNGGGQPFFASGKGKNVSGIAAAIEKAIDYIK